MALYKINSLYLRLSLRLKNAIQRAWLQRGLLAWILSPLALVYGVLMRLRRTAYDLGVLKSQCFPVAVVVVGNVVVGGAGKTPLIVALALHLKKQGLTVGVVSRGYGRRDDTCAEVLATDHAWHVGDEPALIKSAARIPVFVARRRCDAVRLLLRNYPATEVVLCDDGLQHYALKRDVDIAVFDDRGLGNRWLLPAGLLREPWPQNKARRAKLVLHTGQTPQFDGYKSHRELAHHGVNAAGQQIAMADLKGQAVHAVAAIANPQAFFNMIESLGITLASRVALPDHYSFPNGLLGIVTPGSRVQTVLCTEKDAVKLFSLDVPADARLFAVALKFSPEPSFFMAVDALLSPVLQRKKSEISSTIRR